MRDKTERIQKIKYGILKEKEGEFTEAQLVKKIQSLYDAAIDLDSPDISDYSMPLVALGIPISWTNGNKSLNIDAGLIEVVEDDLTDNEIVDIGDQELPNAFTTGGEFFKVNNEIFEIRV